MLVCSTATLTDLRAEPRGLGRPFNLSASSSMRAHDLGQHPVCISVGSLDQTHDVPQKDGRRCQTIADHASTRCGYRRKPRT